MFENLTSKLKIPLKRRNRNNAANTDNIKNIEHGKIYSLWLIILPLLLGIAFGKWLWLRCPIRQSWSN